MREKRWLKEFLGPHRLLATKNLGLVSATGISSHKLANTTAYARVCIDAQSSSLNGKEKKNRMKQDVEES